MQQKILQENLLLHPPEVRLRLGEGADVLLSKLRQKRQPKEQHEATLGHATPSVQQRLGGIRVGISTLILV